MRTFKKNAVNAFPCIPNRLISILKANCDTLLSLIRS